MKRTEEIEQHRKVLRRLETAHGFCCWVANTMPTNPREGSRIHQTANLWVSVVSTYIGLEQAMKRAALVGSGERKAKGHDLGKLWKMLPRGCQEQCEWYYGEWISAMTAGDEENALPVRAERFIQNIGRGYEKWRYWLNEPEKDEKIPSLHEWPILEIWLAICDWLSSKVDEPEMTPLARGPLLRSIHDAVNEAWEEMMDDLEKEEAGGPEISEIWEWSRPGPSEAAEILWYTGQNNPVGDPNWSDKQRRVYQGWARRMRKPQEAREPRGPYECIHAESLKAWIARAGMVRMQWNPENRRWEGAAGLRSR